MGRITMSAATSALTRRTLDAGLRRAAGSRAPGSQRGVPSRHSNPASSNRALLTKQEEVQYSERPTGEPSMFDVVDEQKMLEENPFPIKPDELIRLTKEAFVKAFAGFKIGDAFPDMKANAYNFHVDPFEGNRVWFSSRAVGTHTGPLMGIEPTGKAVYSPPQASSVTFNEDGLATQLTAGYVMDRAVGNTEGLGGVFGLLWAIGKSPFKFPEGRPWKPSLRYRLFMWFGALAAKFQKK